MIKWLKQKIKRKRKDFKSPYDNSLGVTIWKHNSGGCIKGTIFLGDKDFTEDEKKTHLISWVYKKCVDDGQTTEEIYKQIESNLFFNKLSN